MRTNIMKNMITHIPLLSVCFLLLLFSCSKEDRAERSEKVKELYQSSERLRPLKEYTAENPREWEDIADEHIPRVKKSIHLGKDAIVVTVPLKKATMEHYIERIGVVDKDGREIRAVSFKRLPNPKTYAFFLISDLVGHEKMKVFGKCNLHDRWTAPLDLDKLE